VVTKNIASTFTSEKKMGKKTVIWAVLMIDYMQNSGLQLYDELTEFIGHFLWKFN